MNFWLLGASAALVLIGAVHSVMGERRIFLPWRAAPPRDVPRGYQVILRASWHLPTLLGLGQAAALAVLAQPGGGMPWHALLAPLAAGVAACGVLVAVATRGRHHGGLAMLAAAALILGGQARGPGA
ncbi:MAG: hypothetical protein KA774_14715 [Burkholderiaceae bacterium]|jgi:hypothetical protein|nr:hypothetical protein [Burkholderiaceae bacterium]